MSDSKEADQTADQTELPQVIRTSNPCLYACNSNFIGGIFCCPKELRDGKHKDACFTEWWWRVATLLFALVVSFWAMYLGYANDRATLLPPGKIFNRWEDIPVDSIYRDRDMFACWPATACITRYSYCYIYSGGVEKCINNDPKAVREVGTWCEAGCTAYEKKKRGTCGCLADHGNTSYKNPARLAPCYLDEGVTAKVCTSHADCGSDYCASCSKCMSGQHPEACAPHCHLNISATCDPSDYCQAGNISDSIDGLCPTGKVKKDPCQKAGVHSDPLMYSGHSRSFCPNAVLQDQCLNESKKSPFMWSVVAGLIAMFAVTFFEICRKGYLRITTPVESDTECSMCQCFQVAIIDCIIPILLFTSVFATALTRSYPMAIAPTTSDCFKVGNAHQCPTLTITQNSLLDFWILAWFIAAVLQLIKSFFQFYFLRRMMPSQVGGVPLDLRRYAVVPSSEMEMESLDETKKSGDEKTKDEGKVVEDQTQQPGEKKSNASQGGINILDVLLSICLVALCGVLSVASIIYAMPKASQGS